MASPIPIITGSVTAANVILTRILEIGDRLDTTHENKTEWKKFAKSYQTFANGLQHYDSAIKLALSSESYLSTLDKEELTKLLTALENITTDSDTESVLRELESRLDQDGTTTGSASTEQKKSGKKLLSKFKKVIKHPAISHAQRDEKKINKLKENLEKAENKLKEGKKLIEDKFGIFNRHFKECYRGNNIYLDYDNSEEENASHEAKLKHTLLHPSNIGSSTQHSSVPRAVCVEGQGGMGKTTILKDICTDKDMKKKFYDGIHFMTIGEGADDEKVKKEICKSLRNAGFGAVVAKFRDDDSIEDLASRASKIFQGRSMMLVVDDWHPGHVRYLKHMQSILCNSMNGVLLVSSRYKQISSECQDTVPFKELEPTGEESRKILLARIGEKAIYGDDDEIREAMDKILIVCGGIKLCLAVAGSNIQRRGERLGIKRYAEDLESMRDEVVTMAGGEDMRSFLSVLLVSLDHYNKDHEQHLKRCDDIKGRRKRGMDVKNMFKGFCVFEKQQNIPFEAISRLWDINRGSVARIVRNMSSYCLLRIDEDERSVELHDKVMDAALYLAEEDGKDGVGRHHESILRGHMPLLGRMFFEEEEERGMGVGNEDANVDEEAWWERFSCPQQWDLGEEEEYFVKNVCRHLEGGGRVKELWELVTNVGWTLRRRGTGGLAGLVSDLNRLKGLCDGGRREGEVGKLLNGEEKVGMDVLMNHIRDGWMGILEDEHMIGFEIFGRVLKEDRGYGAVKGYLKSIEKEGPRPWLRPVTASLGRANGRQIGEIRARDGSASCDNVSSDCRFVVFHLGMEFEVIDIETQERWHVEGEKGESLVCTSMCSQPLRVACGWMSGKVTVWDVEKGEEACDPLTGHHGPVWCVVMSGDGNRVVSGGSDGSVRVWDVEKGEEACDPLTGHDVWVSCVVMSGDGNRVVSGGEDGSVRVWDVEKGEEACDPLTGHDGEVWCVGMSGDGNRVVSSGWDGSVRVWDVEKGEEACHPLTGHDGWVRCVVMSGDGNRVVSGGNDGSVRVWDVEKGEEACDPLTGHDGCVECVVMSGDGNRVVSGGEDGSVRVWDVEKGEKACDPLTGHDGPVSCVVMSGDGNRVVSRGLDGSVRVWDVEKGEEACDRLTGHDGYVSCVVMSRDGSRVVSGGEDGSVRVWDVEKGEEACDRLPGHDGEVNCVVMSGDGNRVVFGGLDGSVRVWDVEKGEEACDPLRHDGWVECVVMSGDGNRVVSGGRDGSVRVWDVQRGLQLGRDLRCRVATEDEYKSWLTTIQSSIANQDGANESSICIKSLHQDNIPVLERMDVSIANDSVCCDCSVCEKDKYSVDNRATAMWVENEYIYVNSERYVKVGRKESNAWCMNGETIAIGLRNGRVMICRLET